MNYQELICKLNNNTYHGHWTAFKTIGVNIMLNDYPVFEIFESGRFELLDLRDITSKMDKIIVKFLNQPRENWFEGVNNET